LILAATGVLAAWILGWQFPRTPTPAPTAEVVAPPIAPAPERRWAPRQTPRPAPGCAPRAARSCIQGDPWWLDGCGTPYEKADECGRRRCLETECEPEDPPNCGGVPTLGRCVNDVAYVCNAGQPVEVDCVESSARCVMTEEGPACRPSSDDDCNEPPSAATCDGPELVACVEGTRQRFDCRAQGGWCGPLPGGLRVGCVVDQASPADTCGVCGCPLARTDEWCDGRDNDADGYIDEDDNCGEVDLVAFVVEDARGNSSYSDEDLRDELARINEAFARDDDYGLKFRLAEVVALRRPEWLSIDDAELDQILATGAVHPDREEFYVPMLFTDELSVDQVPRPGLSTGPNGFCGRMRRTPHPQSPVGIVALAKRRWPTTATHELGHFFGLCHTHGDTPSAAHRFEPGSGGEDTGEACADICAAEADGICDTPEDPGPTECRTDSECGAQCDHAQTPDPTNVMGYYPDCRDTFTQEQALLMRTTLFQRRSWHPCIWGDGCDCDPLAPRCPESMTCRNLRDERGTTRWICGMEGASVPSGPCTTNLDCSDNSICISTASTGGRCVRPCTDLTPNCDCQEVAPIEVPLCMADFAASQ
jgi:hypothetical protein